MLIIGGINSNQRLGNIFEYTFESRSWAMVVLNKNKGLLKGRYGHTAQCVDSKSLIIFGGTEETAKNDILVFDLQSGNLRAVKGDDSTPSERDFHSCC